MTITPIAGPPADAQTWFIADTHFGDRSAFKSRPFGTLNEMADTIRDNWRACVGEGDTVWVVGDVGKDVECYRDLPGRKHLVGGNWDGDMRRLDMFDEVHGCKYLKGIILTHIPVHEGQVGHAFANVHGHLHSRIVQHDRYLSVSVEQTQYRPISRAKVDWALRISWMRRYPLALPGVRARERALAA